MISIVHPDFKVQVSEHYLKEKDENHREYFMEFQIIRQDGEIRWIEHHCNPVFDDHGKFIGRRGTNHDITERVLAKNILRKSEEKYRLLFENAPDGVTLIDAETIIRECNEVECNMLGYSREEIIRKSITKFLTKESHGILKKGLPTLMKEGFFEAELFLTRKDGVVFPVWRRVSAIYDDNGTFAGAIAYTRDMTDFVKHREELVLAKEKAVESDRLKSTFLNNMSHELRTPMNGIIGFSGLFLEPDMADENRVEYGQIIKTSCNRLLNTVENILEISMLETRQLKTVEKELCLNTLLEKLFSVFKSVAEKKKIQFTLKKGLSDKESNILSDESKLHKIVSNLLENAFKFTTTGSVEISCRVVDKRLEISVEDTGKSIDPENWELVFERFWQEDKGFTRVTEGLGLGLAIVKGHTLLWEEASGWNLKRAKVQPLSLIFHISNRMRNREWIRRIKRALS
ncbi:MAG: PAS domain-containing sensor histidine kinase, partial [Bacteroidia bacterium]|nr:PAS domain-containing sensor histidine kinase [Bacteroidia bacterium]